MRTKTLFYTGVLILFNCIFALAALDLRFTTAIAQSPDPATAGETLTFTVSFRTDGGAVTNLKIIGGVDGAQIHERTYASIGADLVRTDSFTWTATAGSHTVWFELDPDHTSGDSNYANNRVEKAITVDGGTPAGKPDLTLSIIQDPSKLEEGKPVVLGVTVKNSGDAASVACKGILKEDGIETESETIPPIAAGGEWKATILRTVKCGAKFEILVDTDNLNVESNESNNTWAKIMKCGLIFPGYRDLSAPIKWQDPNGPDLRPIIYMWDNQNPSLADYKEHLMQFNVIVTNLGKVNSVPCTMTVKKNNDVIYSIKLGIIPYAGHASDFQNVNLTAVLKCKDKLSVIVDSDNKNAETNENNNTNSKTFLCLNK